MASCRRRFRYPLKNHSQSPTEREEDTMASSSTSSLFFNFSFCAKNKGTSSCPKHGVHIRNSSSLSSNIINSRKKEIEIESNYANNVVIRRREAIIRVVFGASALSLTSINGANGAGLPPEEKPRLCDDTCEKELENVPMVTTESGLQYKDIKVGQGPSPPVGFQVTANYVAMVPSGQIFDSSLEKGTPYIFRVGSGQVIKGLDEGILSMKVGGKRRLYIPGSLAFPKGLNSAPGRPRVAPNSPVIFDVSLEYIPGLESEEE